MRKQPRKLDTDLNQAYEKYRNLRCDRSLEDITAAGEPLVKYYAGIYGGGCDFDDLFQTGMLGILKAVHSFKPDGKTAFLTWASWCVISEIRHYVRSERKYHYPRCLEKVQNRMDEALETSLREGKCFLNESELEEKIGINSEGIHEIMKAGLVSLSELNLDCISSLEKQSFQLPLEDRLILEQAMDKLNGMEKKVVQMLFFRGFTQQKAAKSLGVNQRKVSRIKVSAIKTLKGLLDGKSFTRMDNSKSFRRIK